jgi:ferrous iron transport protein A
MMSLELLTPGERGEITEIRHCGGCGGGCHSHGHGPGQGHGRGLGRGRQAENRHATRAEEMGLRVGKQVEMLSNSGNLLLLLVDDTRIAIDRRMARSINVKGMNV